MAWFRFFPQYSAYPPDQAGYLAGGHALWSIASAGFHHGLSTELITKLRRWFDFLGIALLYGAIDLIRPSDLDFARLVFAVFNALGAWGSYSLARRLASPVAGGIALLYYALSPAFPSGASRLYSDAVTGCLLVWSVRLFVEGGRKLPIIAGLLAGLAMLIRVQLLPWVPLGLAGFTAVAWLRGTDGDAKSLIKRGWLGLGAPLIAFALLTYFGLENKNDSAPKHNLPRYHYYAYGFWQYLESDGWEGPWRLKQDPFYLEMVKASADDPKLLRSRPLQYLFAARYVAPRLDKAVPIVLGNFYRIFNRPQNPEHRGFIPVSAATLVHRAALIAAIIATLGLWYARSPGLLAPALILSLGAFHSLAWGWPRYLMPVLPVLLSLSGMGTEGVWKSFRKHPRPWVGAALMLVTLFVIALGIREIAPQIAWWVQVLLLVVGLSAPIVLTLKTSDGPVPPRHAVVVGIFLLSSVVFGNAWRDLSWHEQPFSVRAGDIVRQRIRVSTESLAHLRGARERFVAVDLELTDPGRQPWDATINGIPAELTSSLPPLPESIPVPKEGRTYPQWWIVPLSDAMLERASTSGEIIVDLYISDPTAAVLKADRFREQSTRFEAPSLGDWPYAAGIKPEYDRDFRLVESMKLASVETNTLLVREGRVTATRPIARIRIFELDDRSGRVSFEVKRRSVDSGVNVQTVGFGARAAMRDRGDAQIEIGGVPIIPFRIASFRDAIWTSGPFTLCYRDRTTNRKDAYESRGIYLLSGPLPCRGDKCTVDVRFWPAMDDRPMSFIMEPLRSVPTMESLTEAASACSLPGHITWDFDRLLDATTNSYPADRGRWRVARIY